LSLPQATPVLQVPLSLPPLTPEHFHVQLLPEIAVKLSGEPTEHNLGSLDERNWGDEPLSLPQTPTEPPVETVTHWTAGPPGPWAVIV